MKLNNAQITALARKFKVELLENKKIIEKQEIEKYYKSKKPIFDSCIKLLQKNSFLTKVSVNLEKGYEGSINKDSKHDNWISTYSITNNILDLKIKIPELDELKTEIVLATIDSQSIEDILNILKTKYK
jgi:CTP:phosphocholine cytidylyltransferase-like protein